MLRKLVLFLILICSTGIAYGQHDYQIRETNYMDPYIYIEPKDAWERRRVFIEDKTPYQWVVDDFEGWYKRLASIRKTCISAAIMQKMIESQTNISVSFVADSDGNMVDIQLGAETRILNILSKQQLIDLYQQIWTTKISASRKLKKDEYFLGRFDFLTPIPKRYSDESK